MGRIFLCYKPLHPPTGVEHCCFARLTGPQSTELVLAHANILEVYTLHTLPNGEVVSEAVASFTLAARVEALSVLPLGNNGVPDVLLVTVRPAKAVLLCWEREAGELCVLDLYSFEHDAIGLGSNVRADPPDVDRPEGIADMAVTVMDPQGRCAAMLVYGNQLAVMPFKREALARRIRRILLASQPQHAARRADLLQGGRLHPRRTLSTALMALWARGAQGAKGRRRRREGKGAGGAVGGKRRRAAEEVGAGGEGLLDLEEEEEGEEGAAMNGRGGEEEDEEEEDDDLFVEEEEDDDGANGLREGAAVDDEAAGGGGGGAVDGGKSRSEGMEAAEGSLLTELGGAGARPFVLKLRGDLGMDGLVRDLCFLGGFIQPTLAVLHMQPPSWGGTLAARAHCGHLSILSLSLPSTTAPSKPNATSKITTLFKVPFLPHDSFRVIPPPDPGLLPGGVLVVSANALHFVQDGRVRAVAATNGFAPTTVATARHPLQKPEDTGLASPVSLEGARVGFLSPHVALLTAGTGELLGLRLESRAGVVTALRLQRLGGGEGGGVFATAVAVIGQGVGPPLAFLASRTVDSLLLRYRLEPVVAAVAAEGEGGGGGKEGQQQVIKGEPGVSQAAEEVVVAVEEEAGGSNSTREPTTPEEEEEVAMYGRVVVLEAAGPTAEADETAVVETGEGGGPKVELGARMSLQVVDAFPSMGPLVSGAAARHVPAECLGAWTGGDGGGEEGEAAARAAAEAAATAASLRGGPQQATAGAEQQELLCCGGQGGKGALVLVRRGVVADTLGRAPLPEPCSAVWVLPSVVGDSSEGTQQQQQLGGFVVAAFPGRTAMYRYLGAKLEAERQPEQLGFHTGATTFALAPVGGGRGLVQVYGSAVGGGGDVGGVGCGLRLVWDGEPAQEMVLHDERDVGGAGVPAEASVVAVAVEDPYVLCVLSDGTARLLVLDEEEGECVPGGVVGGEEGGSPITAACLFRWRPGMGFGEKGEEWLAEEEGAEDEAAAAGRRRKGEDNEEEQVLYGAPEPADGQAPLQQAAAAAAANGPSTAAAPSPMEIADGPLEENEAEQEQEEEHDAAGPVLCCLCRADGTLEVAALPDFRPVFRTARCAEGGQLLRNALLGYPDLRFRPSRRHGSEVEAGSEGETPLTVREVCVAPIGPAPALGTAAAATRALGRLCLLLWTSEEDLLVYVGRSVVVNGGGQAQKDGLLPLVFARLGHDLITRPPRHAHPLPPAALGQHGHRPPRRLFPFAPHAGAGPAAAPVGGQHGVFIGGGTPAWVLCERGSIAVLPAQCRDAYAKLRLPPHAQATAFAPFPDAEAGFLLAHVGGRTEARAQMRAAGGGGSGSDGGACCLSLLSADVGGVLGYTTATGASRGASVTLRRIGPLGYEAKHVVALGTQASALPVPYYAAIVSRAAGGQAADEAEFEAVVDPFATGGVEDEEGVGGAGEGEGDTKTFDPSLAKSGERLTDFTSPKEEYLGAPSVPALWAGGHRLWLLGGAPFRLKAEIPLKPHERGAALLVFRKGPRSPHPPPRPPPPPHYNEPWRGRGPPPPPTPQTTPEEEDWYDPHRDNQYVFVGTAKLRAKGEDVPTQGRIVAYRVDENGGKGEGARLVQVDEASQRSGPPTALTQLGDRVIAACGPTLWVFSFVREKLRPIAFYDADFFVVALRAVKHFVAATDAYSSVHLLRWSETDPTHQLELLGKDYTLIHTAQPGSTAFVVDPPSLGMLVGDDRGNLRMLQYDAADPEARGGNRLVRRADFHLSHRPGFLLPTPPGPVARPGALPRGLRLLLFGTVEGGAGSLFPVEEKVFRRLHALQAVMVNALPHVGAFNPRGFRLVEARDVGVEGRKKAVLDGELLWRYCALDRGTQEDLAGAVGSSRVAMLDTLLECDMMTWVL